MGGSHSQDGVKGPSSRVSHTNDDTIKALLDLKKERRLLMAEKAGLKKILELQAEYASSNKYKSYEEIEKKKNDLNSDRIHLMEYSWEHDCDTVVRVSTRIDDSNISIGQLLATRTRWQLHHISDTMKRKYGMTLFEVLQTIYNDADPNEKYTKVLLGYRVADPIERDVILLHSYVSGTHLQVKEIIEIVMTRNNDELRNVVTSYLAKYGKSFSDHFRSKCKDLNLSEFMMKVLECNRDESDHPFSDEEAKAKAIQLYDAGAGKTFGSPELNVFVRVLCNVSVAQFDSINEHYRNKQLREDITKTLPGAFCAAVLARSSDKYHTLALYLRRALRRDSLNIGSVVGILGSLSHNQCVKLRVIYDEGGAPSLVQSMETVLSGPLLVACEALVAGDVRYNPVGTYREAGIDERQCEIAFRDAAIAAKDNYKQKVVEDVGEKELIKLAVTENDSIPISSIEEFHKLSSQEQSKINKQASSLLQSIRIDIERLKNERKQAKRDYIEFSGKLAENLVWIKIIEDQVNSLMSYVVQCDCADIHREFGNVKKLNVDRANRTLIRILCKRDRKHWAKIEARYEQYTGKSLMAIIGSREVEDHLQPFLINIQYSANNKPSATNPKAIIRGVVEMDVNRIHNFIKKFATRSANASLDYLLEILCTRTNREMIEIKTHYRNKYSTTLEAALQPVIEESPLLFTLFAQALKAKRDESGTVNLEAAKTTCFELIIRRRELMDSWNAAAAAHEQSFFETAKAKLLTDTMTNSPAVTGNNALENILETDEEELRTPTLASAKHDEIHSMFSKTVDQGHDEDDIASGTALQLDAMKALEEATPSTDTPTNLNTILLGADMKPEAFENAILADKVSKDEEDEKKGGDDWDVLTAHPGNEAESTLAPADAATAAAAAAMAASLPGYVPPPIDKVKRAFELFELYIGILGPLGLPQLSLIQEKFPEFAGEGFAKGLVELIKDDLGGTPEGDSLMDSLFAWLGDRVLYSTRVLYQAISSSDLQPSLVTRLFTRSSLLDCRKIINCYRQNYGKSLAEEFKKHLDQYPYLLQALLCFVFEDDTVDVGDPRLKVMIKDPNFFGTPRPIRTIGKVDLTCSGLNSLAVYASKAQRGRKFSLPRVQPIVGKTDVVQLESAVRKRQPRNSFVSAYVGSNKVKPEA